MRNPILRLHPGLSLGVSMLHALLIVFAQGCGPVCTGTSGSCLNLRVSGPASSTGVSGPTRLSVWLGGLDLSGNPIVVSGMVNDAGLLPTQLLIQPPPSMSQVDRVSVQLLSWSSESAPRESGSLLLTGRTNLVWPSGTQIDGAVRLKPPSAPFIRREDVTAGENPRSVVALDVNHDGLMDLAVRDAGATGDSVLLILANADGTFAPAQTIYKGAAGHSFSELAASDLDADHHTDLTFADTSTGMVHVLYGKGDGSLHEPTLFYSQTTEPGWLIAADLDGDRREDLLIAGKTGALKILWNEDAGFLRSTVLAPGSATASLLNLGAPSLVDVNGDGMLDVVAAGRDGSGALQLWQHGSGRSFLSALVIDPQVSFPFAMTAQDFDGDTWTDLLTSSTSSSGQIVFRKGDGSSLPSRYAQALSSAPGFMLATDLNDDLIPDLAWTDATTVVPALGNGLGGFQSASCASEHCQLSGSVLQAQAKDLNGDGEPELLLVTEGKAGEAGKVNILRHSTVDSSNKLGPTVSGVAPATVPNNVTTTLTLTGANFEADSKVTVGGVDCNEVRVHSRSQLTCSFPGRPQHCGGQRIVVTRPDRSIGTLPAEHGLWLSSARLDFAPATRFQSGRGPSDLVAGDFNTDQKLDLVTVNNNGGNVSVMLGDGKGGFGSPRHFAVGSLPLTGATGDFNGDTKLDLLISNSGSDTVSILLGDGLGGFAAAKTLPTGPSSRTIGTADFNNDQKLDFAVVAHGTDELMLHFGDGEGGFGAPTKIALNGTARMAIADLNGDGRIDLAIPSPPRDIAYLLFNNGMGFAPPMTLSTVGGPVNIVARDVNGDRKPDLLVHYWNRNDLGVHLGDGKGSFAFSSYFHLDPGAASAMIRDINGDGKMDLAILGGEFFDVVVQLGDGRGGFGVPNYFKLDWNARGLVAEDFNGDGLIDLASADWVQSEVFFLQQRCQ